ncbi:MAG: helix-turn-helix domain-containing protein [Streptosporangiaceae bacterium]
MTGGQRVELEGLARSHTAPAREVRQAKALLWATDGVSNAEIARRCASTPKSVRRWRSRFAAEGTAAVGRIRAGRGRPAWSCRSRSSPGGRLGPRRGTDTPGRP